MTEVVVKWLEERVNIRTMAYRSKIIDVESERLMELAKQGGIEFENQMELMDKLENEMAALTKSSP